MLNLSKIVALEKKLADQFGLHALIGAEVEFYISPVLNDEYLNQLAVQLNQQFSLFEKLEREKGDGQLEIALKFTGDVKELIFQYNKIKTKLIPPITGGNIYEVAFSPKPYPNQPSSGLHIHTHLENEKHKNVFYKKDEDMSEELRYSIAGLLAQLPHAANKLWITKEDKARISSNAHDVPSTISWGGNNRSCAIRLPDKAPHNKHIEYRLAGADADISQVIEIVLEGILFGLETKPQLQPQTFGNAYDAQYGLKKLL